MVEFLPSKQDVAGSNPVSRYYSKLHQGGVPEWPKGADCKSAGDSLRRFESFPLHNSSFSSSCSLVLLLTIKTFAIRKLIELAARIELATC